MTNNNEFVSLIEELESIPINHPDTETSYRLKLLLLISTKYYLRSYAMGTCVDDISIKKIRNSMKMSVPDDESDIFKCITTLNIDSETSSYIFYIYYAIKEHLIISYSELDFEILFNVMKNSYKFNIIYRYKEWCNDSKDVSAIESLIDGNLKNETFVISNIKNIIMKYHVLCSLDMSKDIITLRHYNM